MHYGWKISPLFVAAGLAACNTKNLEDHSYEPTPSISSAPTPGPQPSFPNPVSANDSPPPISGGTMAVGPDGRTVVIADSDRDQIYVVDVPTRTVKSTLRLALHSEPGRVAFDTHGKAYVALRGSGNLATVDLATLAISEQHLCVAPRGVAFDAKRETLHVACAEGVLVSLFQDGTPMRRLTLDKDLRDVIVSKNKLLVSRFRNADVLVLDPATGSLEKKTTTHGGNLGWRSVAPPTAPPASDGTTDDSQDDEPAIVSQDPVNPTGPVTTGYYGSGASGDACTSVTITSTRLDIPGRASIFIPPAVLPVDLATNGREYAIVAAGNGHTASALPQLFIHNVTTQSAQAPGSTSSSSGSGPYYPPSSPGGFGTNPECTAMAKALLPGQAVAAAFDGEDQLLVQSREPAALYIMSPDRQSVWKEISLSPDTREDTGHAIFHSNSGGFLACASCHAEGGEDGRTWTFVEGDRRTPSMRGTIDRDGPFHWDGKLANMRALVKEVLVTRMSGPEVTDPQLDTLKNWLFKLPAPPRIEQPADKVARGADLFTSQGCTTCHSGVDLTTRESKDVGTGGMFKVPSLVGVGWRAPFLHNGCAHTMKDRFGVTCGGANHGTVANLDSAQISDLSTFLESL